jgi:hypothetical protein
MDQLLSLLPALACPLGMGLMMWLMMRGTKGQPTDAMQMPAQDIPDGQTSAAMGPEDRLAELHAQLDMLRAQQTAIAAQISQLSEEDQPVRVNE